MRNVDSNFPGQKITRRAIYIQRNNETCSCNHCCSGKAVRITTIFKRVCRLRYPEFNAHAPYCHLRPLRLYYIFPHYLINGTVFEKTLMNLKCVFLYSLQLLSVTFLTVSELRQILLKMFIFFM